MAVAGARSQPKTWFTELAITRLRLPWMRRAETRTPAEVAGKVQSIFSVLSLGYRQKGARWAGRELRRFTSSELAPALVQQASGHAQAKQVIAALSHAGNWVERWVGRNPHADYVIPALLENSPWTFGHIEVWKNAVQKDRQILKTSLSSDNRKIAGRALEIVHSLGEIVAGELLQTALKKKGTESALAEAIRSFPHDSWTKNFLKPGFDPEANRSRIVRALGQG